MCLSCGSVISELSIGASVRYCKTEPVTVLQMLSTVLNIIIFEDCRNQWSMSRPLLGLILLNEKVNVPHTSIIPLNHWCICVCVNTCVGTSCSILLT